MIKDGQVKTGKTPSVVSGLPSEVIKDGEPVRKDEKPEDPGLKKLAAALDESPKD